MESDLGGPNTEVERVTLPPDILVTIGPARQTLGNSRTVGIGERQ